MLPRRHTSKSILTRSFYYIFSGSEWFFYLLLLAVLLAPLLFSRLFFVFFVQFFVPCFFVFHVVFSSKNHFLCPVFAFLSEISLKIFMFFHQKSLQKTFSEGLKVCFSSDFYLLQLFLHVSKCGLRHIFCVLQYLILHFSTHIPGVFSAFSDTVYINGRAIKMIAAIPKAISCFLILQVSSVVR